MFGVVIVVVGVILLVFAFRVFFIIDDGLSRLYIPPHICQRSVSDTLLENGLFTVYMLRDTVRLPLTTSTSTL